jgi:hypothetical protein
MSTVSSLFPRPPAPLLSLSLPSAAHNPARKFGPMSFLSFARSVIMYDIPKTKLQIGISHGRSFLAKGGEAT